MTVWEIRPVPIRTSLRLQTSFRVIPLRSKEARRCLSTNSYPPWQFLAFKILTPVTYSEIDRAGRWKEKSRMLTVKDPQLDWPTAEIPTTWKAMSQTIGDSDGDTRNLAISIS